MGLRSHRGTILIITLWVLLILTVFALALGQQASLEIKLSGYQKDKLKAFELAKAAIERVVWEKQNEAVGEVDALSESWANNEQAFKNFNLGEGTFTVSYYFEEENGGEDVEFYGMEDEESKINVNTVEEDILRNLFKDYDNADEIAASIAAWRSEEAEPEEEAYYQGLDQPYSCKNAEFKSIAELLLVRGLTAEIIYGEDKDGDGEIFQEEQGLARYLTVFGSGKVNVNTAAKKVLEALIDDSDLVDKIVRYRKGSDDELGTSDDYWFSITPDIVNLEGDPAKDLTAGYSFDLLFGVNSTQWAKLQDLIKKNLSVSSNTYTVYARAVVKKVEKSIIATVGISGPGQIEYFCWYRN